jgi:imidazolonepropionase-like amidohydrolase
MQGSFRLLAGWLIDGTGGPILLNVVAEVERGMILSIREMSKEDILSPRVIDFSQCTVVPGLVDCHVHLTMSGTKNPDMRRSQLQSPFEQAQPVIHRHILQHLAHGVLALRDGGDYAAHTLRYKLENLPLTDLPIHLKAAGRAWRSAGRYGRLIGRPPLDGLSLAQSIALGEEMTDHIKIVNSGLNSLLEFGKETPPQFTLDALAAAVRSGKRQGLKIMVHANGRVPVKLAVEAGCHSIEHGFFMGGKNLQAMAERSVFWVPTAYSMKAYSEQLDSGSLEVLTAGRNLDHQLEQLARAREQGVPVAVGTDGGSLGVHHGRAFVEELKLLMEAGYSLENAIRCASLNGALLLNLENELGCLKPGMPASFVVTRGGPSCLPDALKYPHSVFIRGNSWLPEQASNSAPMRVPHEGANGRR